jgi:hypothetical protein
MDRDATRQWLSKISDAVVTWHVMREMAVTTPTGAVTYMVNDTVAPQEGAAVAKAILLSTLGDDFAEAPRNIRQAADQLRLPSSG